MSAVLSGGETKVKLTNIVSDTDGQTISVEMTTLLVRLMSSVRCREVDVLLFHTHHQECKREIFTRAVSSPHRQQATLL
jgi:hypothetical protein